MTTFQQPLQQIGPVCDHGQGRANICWVLGEGPGSARNQGCRQRVEPQAFQRNRVTFGGQFSSHIEQRCPVRQRGDIVGVLFCSDKKLRRHSPVARMDR